MSSPQAPRETGNMDQFYDKFTVRLEGMQVLVAKPGGSGLEADRDIPLPVHA